MKILLAESAGACYGVKRALELAEQAALGTKSVQTLGPLIHNPNVVASLEEQGVEVANAVEDVSSDKVILRSHGVTPEVLEKLSSLNCEVIDATCPHVSRAQHAALDLAKAGYCVVVVGEKDHPEVEGLCAWARLGGSRVVVAKNPSELPGDLPDKVGVVVQTTQARSVLQAVVDELIALGINPHVKDTICSSTSKRQYAAEKLAQEVDAMVIVGGKNSSNTKRLAEICAKYTPKVFHIESAKELNPQDFENVGTVGISAGASTPDAQISAVVDYLHTW